MFVVTLFGALHTPTLVAASTEGTLAQQENGEYWWITANTRRWLDQACGAAHIQAGMTSTPVDYASLANLARNAGPCPEVTHTPDPGALFRQTNGEYWWIENNTRRWVDASCGASHEASSGQATLINYTELAALPRQAGPCPRIASHDSGGHDQHGDDTTNSGTDYASNLAMIHASSVRNTNHDASPYKNTPSNELVLENHFGPRSDYLQRAGGNPENAFPVSAGGQFRAGCEFSHFAYDDPIVFPGKPGAAHLHMFFGNTDVNAYSTYDSLINSGSSTCNGQELNRTGYWAPAMFDGNGNVRIPERIVVYYKGEGLARGRSQTYPEGAAMVTSQDINAVHYDHGGALGKQSFSCTDQYSSPSNIGGNTIPNCRGDRLGPNTEAYVVLEMNVKFPQCWNGQDPSNPDNYRIPAEGGWYYSMCRDGEITLPNLEYFINYRVDYNEDTSDWYLSSDVDSMTLTRNVAGGTTIHADWWGGWHKEINQRWIDNCVNFKNVSEVLSGCGFGYLTDGGPEEMNPYPGPALKMREQYDATGSNKVPASLLFQELCDSGRAYTKDEDAAYCKPAMKHHH